MGDAMEFIAEILSVSNQFPEDSKNYYYKTCILYTASIIESHIHYCILKKGITEFRSKQYTYSNIKVLHICEENKKIMIGKREKAMVQINGSIDFNILNSLAVKNNIYDTILSKKIDKVRKLRNQIHLMKLEDIDRKYSKIQLNETFDTARELFKIIEGQV